MTEALVAYLTQRPEGAVFLLPGEIQRSLHDLFKRPEWILPKPYKIYFTDEAQLPLLGFPVAHSPALAELDTRLEKWLVEEVLWQLKRAQSKDRVQTAFNAYVSHLLRLTENAMLSNLLSDYHGVFWLAHSLDLAKHFSAIPRKVSALDAAVGRTQGDQLKYRIFAKWVLEVKEQMAKLAARLQPILDGEEERGLQFFRTLCDNVLLLTDEFFGPDLRELRSFVNGYLNRDFHTFRETLDRMQALANDLLNRDRVFRSSIRMFGVEPEQGITLGLLLDRRFQKFLFEIPAVDAAISREEREQIHSISRRLCEFAVLHQLRRGIVWMTTTSDGEILASDRKGAVFSRSTRPIDLGRPGVVDPMVHRFGLMYDIAAFSETLGNLAKAGWKGEMTSYRQMLLFQRKLEVITERHRLQFEKFLGDGAFYTTRRALRLIRAAIEIQRFYSEMKKKGFAFSKGMRVALNYGYYRLLPMKGGPESPERVMEFYGPGVVELSRLTTGKATKEIEEIQSFLVQHGYEANKVHQFFAPLARGVDVIDHRMHQREFYAYVNSNGHLINEGIVASMSLVKELSLEVADENLSLARLTCDWGQYIGFEVGLQGVEWVGIRLIGSVSLKGLDKVEVGEVVPFAPGEAQSVPVDRSDTLMSALRQIYHDNMPTSASSHDNDDTKTRERAIDKQLVLCSLGDGTVGSLVLIGQWDPGSDQVFRSIRIPGSDLELVGLTIPLDRDTLESKKAWLTELYGKMRDQSDNRPVELGHFRTQGTVFLLGEHVEQL